MELLPCPFCQSALVHEESGARSFDPPRIYHEFHHPDVPCFLRGRVYGFTDDEGARNEWAMRWNTRAQAKLAPAVEWPSDDALMRVVVNECDTLDITITHEWRNGDWHATTIFDGDAALLRAVKSVLRAAHLSREGGEG